MTTTSPLLGVCRLCGDPSWLADEEGPVHPCCKLHNVQGPKGRCPACQAAKALRSQGERRAKRL